jgi:hypothetical protein
MALHGLLQGKLYLLLFWTVTHLEFFQKQHFRNWITSVIRCKKGKAPTQPGLFEQAGFY